jgi:hypothetical protein
MSNSKFMYNTSYCLRSQSTDIYTSYQVKLKDPEDNKKHSLYKIWGSHGSVVENSCPLQCCTGHCRGAFIFKSQVVKEGPRRFFLNCLTLKMKDLSSFTTSVSTHPATHHIPEVKNPEHSVSPHVKQISYFHHKGTEKSSQGTYWQLRHEARTSGIRCRMPTT